MTKMCLNVQFIITLSNSAFSLARSLVRLCFAASMASVWLTFCDFYLSKESVNIA